MNTFKKITMCSILMLVIGTAVFSEGRRERIPKPKTELKFSTGIRESANYVAGALMSEVWNNDFEEVGYRINMVSSDGDIDNLSLLKRERVDFALVVLRYAVNAHEGVGRFSEQSYKDMRVVASLWPSLLYFIVSDDSEIRTVDEIDGTSFSIGQTGSGTSIASLFVLRELAGLYPGDFTDYHYDAVTARSEFLNGDIVGIAELSGTPSPLVSAYTESTKRVFILNFSFEDYRALRESDPLLGYYAISADDYLGLDRDLRTFGWRVLLLSRADTSDEVVYIALKSLYSHINELQNKNTIFRDVSLQNATSDLPNIIKLHPGAIRFYDEQAITFSDSLR